MSKIVIEEFDACHKFVDEIEFFVLPIEKRKFVEISHVVSCDDFVIFVSYDLRGEIQQFICDIIGEAKKNDLCRHGWKVYRRLIEETKNEDCYRFVDSINIIFTVQKKCLH